MCAIHGFVSLTGQPVTRNDLLAHLIIAGSERGRDSWGIVTSNGQWIGDRGEPEPFLTLDLHPAVWAMANNRAEPTTERQRVKDRANIQPFVHNGVAVSHNGTIANDKELAAKYGLQRTSTIDSAVLPPLVSRCGPAFGFQAAVSMMLNQIVGSYSMAIGYADQLILACNYRPLHLQRRGNIVAFSSQADYLPDDPLDWPTVTVPPYSFVTFHEHGPTIRSLIPPRTTARVLVVCSGGLDSTVAATVKVHEGNEVTLLHFTYGCRAEEREVEAVGKVAAALGCETMTVDVRHLFRNVIGGSPLTGTGSIAPGEAGAEFAFEWVPARNLILLAIATGIAEAHGFDELVLGNNIEEAGAYPDNEAEFIRLLNQVLPYAVADGKHVIITMPVGNLVKHEIVALGHRLGAPIAESWSCYNATPLHCGRCGPCYMRHHAHTMNDLRDPTIYEATP
jgi:7-cyano-7-deazaguanine synthase